MDTPCIFQTNRRELGLTPEGPAQPSRRSMGNSRLFGPHRPSRRSTVRSSRASNPAALKQLSLEELSQIEVTTPSKEPTKVSQTAAAIYVITGEDIRRSGATSIPEALRLAPGVEVARIDGNNWSIGIRGFGSPI